MPLSVTVFRIADGHFPAFQVIVREALRHGDFSFLLPQTISTPQQTSVSLTGSTVCPSTSLPPAIVTLVAGCDRSIQMLGPFFN
jgi:hypothetical protein